MVDRVLVTLDGKFRNPEQPLLYADDLGALRGDGVFETVLVRAGRACALELHLARLRRSAQALDLPDPDIAAWTKAVSTAVGKWGADREGVLRMVVTRGRESSPARRPGSGALSGSEAEPTGYVLVGPVGERVARARADGISVITLARGVSTELAAEAPWLLMGAKTLSYAMNMAALRFAERARADDVIFTSTEHRVLEGPRSTVVIQRGKQLLTPPAVDGVLPGVTQRALFAEAEKAGWECRYKSLFTADLVTAESVWLLSSVTLAARVAVLDGLRMSAPECAGEIAEMVNSGIERAWNVADWQ
ncbi:MAG: aminodeoxychorismate lyase [Nocardia sp.]|nr:aminodeoxychorismate lyase [Nocardia sp.]